MAQKEEIKNIRKRLNPQLTKLENIATKMNLNGNRDAMNVLEIIGNIESVMDEAERLATK